MIQKKHTPTRRCSGCGERFDKPELVRVVRTPDGTIIIDNTGKKSGRGAYICKKEACLKRSRKARRLEQALESQIPDEIYEALLELLNDE